MPRCCGNAPFVVREGTRISLSGSGTPADPLIIASDVDLDIDNTGRPIRLIRGGTGTVEDPWMLSATFADTAKLDDIPDVFASAPSNGQVLAWDATNSRWHPVPPTTAAAGSVTHDNSLQGDGSAGNPLIVRFDPIGYIDVDTDGIRLTDAGINRLMRRFADPAARLLADPAPALNGFSVMDSDPGRPYWWDGAQWNIIKTGVEHAVLGTFLELSGSYGNTPITRVIKPFTVTTDSDGYFDALSDTELEDYGGVLACAIQETGTVAYTALLNPNVTNVQGRAFRVDDGTPLADQSISGIVTADVY